MQGLKFGDSPDSGNDVLVILLDADYFYEIVTGDMRRGIAGPVAISSKLGWSIAGPVDSSSDDLNTSSNFVSCCVVDQNLVNKNTDGGKKSIAGEQIPVNNEK